MKPNAIRSGFISFLLAALSARAVDVEGPLHVLSGSEAVWRVRSPEDLHDFTWSLSQGGQTLLRERRVLRAGEWHTLRFPTRETGQPNPVILTADFGGIPRELWILPEDPFALNRRTLSGGSVSVYDPDGTLQGLLESVHLNLPRLRDPLQSRSAVLIVGELPARSANALALQLPELLNRGVSILWFAGPKAEIDITELLARHPRLHLGESAHPLLKELPPHRLQLNLRRDRMLLTGTANPANGWPGFTLRHSNASLQLLPNSPEALLDSTAGAMILHDLTLDLHPQRKTSP